MADSDDSRRALVCIIAGESTPFRVELAGNKDIIDLKDLIKEKGINSTEHAEYLILWMVRMTVFDRVSYFCFDITDDNNLAYGGYPCHPIRHSSQAR
jgi:Crinkler effector protein N-terminal domain